MLASLTSYIVFSHKLKDLRSQMTACTEEVNIIRSYGYSTGDISGLFTPCGPESRDIKLGDADWGW